MSPITLPPCFRARWLVSGRIGLPSVKVDWVAFQCPAPAAWLLLAPLALIPGPYLSA